MNVFKSLGVGISRLAALLVPSTVEPPRALTEDDVASERFFQRAGRQRGLDVARSGHPNR